MIKLKKIIEEIELYEGLIKTFDIDVSIDILERYFNNEDYNLKFNKDKSEEKIEVEFFKGYKFSEKDFEYFLIRINNLGFQISYYYNNVAQSFKYNKKEVMEKLKNLYTPDSIFKLVLEKKFDVELKDYDLPNEAFHVSLYRNEPKILKIGLIPKNKEKMLPHSERIYFSRTMGGTENLLKDKRFTRNEKEFTIFKIDIKSLKNIKFYKDVNFKEDDAFYTLGNISPQYLTMVKHVSV